MQTLLTKGPLLLTEDIDSIDFTMVKLKICDNEDGTGWTYQQAEDAEIEYKRFLALKRIYPDKDIVPHKAIDDFWHQHILDTQKYADDCQLIKFASGLLAHLSC